MPNEGAASDYRVPPSTAIAFVGTVTTFAVILAILILAFRPDPQWSASAALVATIAGAITGLVLAVSFAKRQHYLSEARVMTAHLGDNTPERPIRPPLDLRQRYRDEVKEAQQLRDALYMSGDTGAADALHEALTKFAQRTRQQGVLSHMPPSDRSNGSPRDSAGNEEGTSEETWS